MKTYHHYLPSLMTEQNRLRDTVKHHSMQRRTRFLCLSDSAVFWMTRGSLIFWSKMPQDLKIRLEDHWCSYTDTFSSLAKETKWEFRFTSFTWGISISCSPNSKVQTQQKDPRIISHIVYGWVSLQRAGICWAHSYLSWNHQSNSVDNRNP